METLIELRAAWQKIGVEWSADKYALEGDGYYPDKEFHLSDESPSLPYIVNGKTEFGRHMPDWLNTMRFLASLPPMEELRIFVTALSAGCDLWDGQIAAEDSGVLEKHGKVTFTGHDISRLFLERSVSGMYPRSKTSHLPNPDRYFEDSPYPEFVSIKDCLRDRSQILEASDIRSLKSNRAFKTCDVVVSNIMNPAPMPLIEFLRLYANHMVVCQSKILFMSDEWKAYRPHSQI